MTTFQSVAREAAITLAKELLLAESLAIASGWSLFYLGFADEPPCAILIPGMPQEGKYTKRNIEVARELFAPVMEKRISEGGDTRQLFDALLIAMEVKDLAELFDAAKGDQYDETRFSGAWGYAPAFLSGSLARINRSEEVKAHMAQEKAAQELKSRAFYAAGGSDFTLA